MDSLRFSISGRMSLLLRLLTTRVSIPMMQENTVANGALLTRKCESLLEIMQTGIYPERVHRVSPRGLGMNDVPSSLDRKFAAGHSVPS